jgi:hypothetical protein
MLAGFGVMDNPDVDLPVHRILEGPGDLVVEEFIDGNMQRIARLCSGNKTEQRFFQSTR